MKRLIAVIASLVVGGCAQLPGASPGGTIEASAPIPTVPSPTPGLAASLTDPVLVEAGGAVFLVAREGVFQLTGGTSIDAGGPVPESVVRVALAGEVDSLIAVSTSDADTIVVSHSNDGGATWKPSGTTKVVTEGGIAEISAAISGTRLVILANETSSSNFSYGAWAATGDDGKWDTGQAPSGGMVSAADGSFWIVGGVTGSEVSVSSDGKQWAAVDLPAQGSFTAQHPTTVSGFGAVLPVTLRSTKGTEIAFFTSADGGKSWKTSASASAPDTEEGSSIPVAVDASGNWVAVWPDGSKVVSGKLGDSEAHFVSPNGLQENVMSVVFSDGALVALTSIQACPSGKASCTSTVALQVSSDGGQTWSIVE